MSLLNEGTYLTSMASEYAIPDLNGLRNGDMKDVNGFSIGDAEKFNGFKLRDAVDVNCSIFY